MSLALRQSKAVYEHETEIVFPLSAPDSPRAVAREITLADGTEWKLISKTTKPARVFHLHDPENI